MYPRELNLKELLIKNSILLLGPRATGKSFLIKQTLSPTLSINLLSAKEYARFSMQPSLLSELASSLKTNSLIVIDEVQKIPALLDEVHLLIEEKGHRFLLTGSSARKLKKRDVNLLAGRAWNRELFPLVSSEIGSAFNLLTYLNQGGLPRSYNSEDYKSELEAYVGTYLKEEVQAEALTRNLPAFSRFLEVMALQSGEELFLEGIANDVGIQAKTISNYIEILEDTLLGFKVPAFQETKKRKAISRSKFYLFDLGVTNYLARRRNLLPGGELFGKAFEQFIIGEVRAYISYLRKDLELFYWRSVHSQEVDLIVQDLLAIEIKATDLVQEKHLKGLKALREEELIRDYLIVSQDSKIRKLDGITIYPWREFLDRLWAGHWF